MGKSAPGRVSGCGFGRTVPRHWMVDGCWTVSSPSIGRTFCSTAMVRPTFSSTFSRCFEQDLPVGILDVDLMLGHEVTSGQSHRMFASASMISSQPRGCMPLSSRIPTQLLQPPTIRPYEAFRVSNSHPRLGCGCISLAYPGRCLSTPDAALGMRPGHLAVRWHSRWRRGYA